MCVFQPTSPVLSGSRHGGAHSVSQLAQWDDTDQVSSARSALSLALTSVAPHDLADEHMG